MADHPNTYAEQEANRLAELYSNVEERLGSPYRFYDESVSSNNERVTKFFETLIAKIKETTDTDRLTDETWYILEDENFHTLCIAIDIIKGKTTIKDILKRYV